jgi:peptidoglycan/LPS O-acetylase OafA/YrhL
MLWIGIIAIGVSPILFGHESYPTLVVGSAAVAIAAAAVVAGMDYAAPHWLRRSMSLRPVVMVGVLSYGIYLWHQPLLRIFENLTLTSRGYRAMAVLIAVLLAGLSHRFVEVPIRSLVRRRTRSARAAVTHRSLEVVPHKPMAAEAER